MTNLSDLSNELADAVQAASKSIVSVRGERPISGTAIGGGHVLTVAHVLHSDDLTVVTSDGKELKASVVGRDPTSDLALLKVDGLDVPALSASTGTRIGELLLAVGQPPHGTQATLGFVERDSGSDQRGWMDSGAAPFRGVSGGALVDARGGLVGILNAGMLRGQLLALPAAKALKVAELLASSGRVPRGYLGIATQPVHLHDPSAEPQGADNQRGPRGHHGRGGRPERPERGPWRRGPWSREDGQRGGWGKGDWGRGGPGWGGRMGGRLGLTIVHIEDASPALQAGLKVGDILLALNHEPLRHPRRLMDMILEHAGDTLTARILRGGEEQDVPVTIGEK